MSDIPSTDIVKPTAVPFVSINVERNSHLVADLYIELTQAVFAKDSEYTLLRILLVGFHYKILRFPRVASTL